MAQALRRPSAAPSPTPSSSERPRPFLKWAGGKTQLLPHILARFPERYGRYHEPFIGGGAVFFSLAPSRATLSDINEDLIQTYRAIRDDVSHVIAGLQTHRSEEEHFYEVRAQAPGSLSEADSAARTIFLNRTCFNGLYRKNRSGQFNVPFGRYDNPTICDADNLQRCAKALSKTTLEVCDVFVAAERFERGDLVYFDPPYDPVSKTASFTSYTQHRFGDDEQARLAELFGHLVRRGVHCVLSNSNTPLIRKLYAGFRQDQVYARRAINSRADRRGPVTELLISGK